MTAARMVGLVAALALSGCGVTSWQRMMDAHQDLHSPEMEASIAEALRDHKIANIEDSHV